MSTLPTATFRLILAVGTTSALLSLLPGNVIHALNQVVAGEPTKSFVDVTEAMGLKGMSGGVAAWGDFDNDGWVDLCVGGQVWRNEKGKRFTRVGDVAGSAIWGDYDNDGYLDLFCFESGRLFRNLKGAKFEEMKILPKLPTTVCLGASWGDFNGDGFLDLYVGGYEVWPDKEYPDVILMSEKGQRFVESWRQTQILRARGITAADFDEDGHLDVFVSNYRLQPNLLWKNDGKGKFTNVAPAYGAAGNQKLGAYGHTIGSAWGDLDNDGHLDLFVGNFSHPPDYQDRSQFLRNKGPKHKFHFEDMTKIAKLRWQESYASPTLGDYDNDGFLDLYFTTVYPGDKSVLYRNLGKWKFEEIKGGAGLSLPQTYQAAWADFDNDGHLDMITGGKLYRNPGTKNHWLKVRLEGDGKVNRAAIGAQVRLRLGGQTLTRQVEGATGQGNQNDLTLHFGLGNHKGPVRLEIRWPDGTRQELETALDRTITVKRVEGGSSTRTKRRVLYNFDGDSCMSTKAGGQGPVAVIRDDMKRLIGEVAYEGSQVDTVLVCVSAQVMYYPTKVGTLRGALSTAAERSKWPASEKQRFKNLQAFFDAGVDPYTVMLAETKRRSREALLTFRMNDDHGNDFLRTQFWVDHPDWRLGKGALDFGRDEVRDFTARLIEEAVRRYDCDGIELDFNRFPTFFKDGTTDERVAKMNSLVERVRKMLDDVGRQRGRRLVLGVRVPSNYGRTPPTPDSCRKTGCDIQAWAKRGWIDFVTVSEFLFERYNLPIKLWKEAVREVPVYGGIECTEGGKKEQYLTPAKYRRAARHLHADGADGIYLFNFFTTREYGAESWEPPFEVLRSLGDPKALSAPEPEKPPESSHQIGSRLELFADDHLIDRLTGKAELRLHHPVPREIALVTDRPWEGNAVNYVTVFRDGDSYRMYYRGANEVYTKDSYQATHREVYCYAESTDGIHWARPNLGLFDFNGSKKNNIVWDGVATHNFTPFKDANPDAKPDARYKALGYGEGKAGRGLYALQSADAIHWSLLSVKPVITKGAFDSQNLAFWDSVRKEYREYHRDFRKGRDIRTATSKDFLTWTEPTFLDYTPDRVSELYTNQVIPYYRAPHLFLGFPTRYLDRGWTESAKALPRPDYRKLRGAKSSREGTALTDGMFMTSRDGNKFRVWPESFIRPGLRTKDNWYYGDNYQNWGLVETKSALEDGPNEISIYVTERTMQDKPGVLRRHTLRIDGFVSVRAPLSGGELVTKLLRFLGKRLALNYSTSAAGSVRVEIQDAAGKPIPGFRLADAQELYGDSLEQTVFWKAGSDVSKLAGQTVRLRFVLRDADVYAFQFQGERVQK